MTVPLVTIGLITFNAEDTVLAALDSIDAQTWTAVEVIIVDDASSDRTEALLGRYAERHPKVRIFANPKNGGAAVSRNRVIAEARGEFIVFFDDDDVSHPDRVGRQVQRILDYERDHPQAAMVVCHTSREQHYPDGTSRIEHTMGEATVPFGQAIARRILMGEPLEGAYGSCATCSQAARAATYRAIGGFDPFFRRSQDTDLCVRLARAGAHFVGIPEPLVVQTMTRTSDKSIERERFFWLALLEKNRDLFASENQYRFCRDWIDVRHDWLANSRASFASRMGRLAVTHPIRTWRRLSSSLRNFGGNRSFSRFHRGVTP